MVKTTATERLDGIPPIDLSIILINWRMGYDVASVLPCIEAHKHRCTVETILVNKPSDDGAEELARDQYPWVRLISHDIFGIAEMRNVGLHAAKGRYCLILDADTELLDGCLDALVSFMEANPHLAGCGGHTTRLNGDVEFNVKRFYDLATVVVRRSMVQKLWPENPWTRKHLMKEKDHDKPFYGDWMAGACFCMRRRAVEEVGVFDERYYFGFEDVDWCWRAKKAGWKIAFNPRARIIHKVQRLSDKGLNKMAIEHLKSGIRFWWKVHHQGLNWAWPSRPTRHVTQGALTELAPEDADPERPDLTVVIVNMNGKKILDDCLKSLREAAPRHQLEVHVVDNASEDDSMKMVREKYPECLIVENSDNLGFTKANNQGIKPSKGRYILLLNNDTRVLPGAFSKAIEWMDQNPTVGCSGLRLLNEDGSLQLSCRRFPSFSQALFNRYSLLTKLLPNNKFSQDYLMSGQKHDEVQDVDWVSGACLMFRRSVYNKIGGLDERFFMYSEDVDYCYQVWQGGWRVVYLPIAEVYHLIGQSSKKLRFKVTVWRHRSMYKFFKKHYSRNLMFVDAITALMVWMRCAVQLAIAGLGAVTDRLKGKG